MIWRITFAAATERDFALIFDHLVQSYQAFGEPRAEALRRAEARLLGILQDADRIATAPERGSRHDELLPGLRQLTLGRASFWFILAPETAEARVLAVFWGGQDQQRHMLVRLLGGPL